MEEITEKSMHEIVIDELERDIVGLEHMIKRKLRVLEGKRGLLEKMTYDTAPAWIREARERQ
jgi:hypothetical protein